MGIALPFGDTYRIAANSDLVVRHTEAWYDDLELIGQADLVVVLEQKNQLALLRDLLFSTPRQEIDVFAADDSAADLLEGSARLQLFAWEREPRQLHNIFDKILFERASASICAIAACTAAWKKTSRQRKQSGKS